MFSQKIAMKLEMTARRALNVKNPGGMAGIVSADYIEKERGAFTVLCSAIAPYYLNAIPEERGTLDDIIDRYRYLEDCSHEEYFKGTDRATEELRALLDMLGVQQTDEF
ncbi:hypothetical protein [Sediminibacillus massiliensis]|uniref:hypothetical protein n=1 Tax=Sediminibacillus massiliensis TaxID=1926277 RepID=UPI0009883E45|nr:hypothetical protein [Sediminibacillus massiliensis]